jgi:hypothetical protein
MATSVTAKTLKAAHVERVQVHAGMRSQVVVVDGVRVVGAVVHLGGFQKQMQGDGSGFVTVQPLKLEILKSILPTAPVVRGVVEVGALRFEVMEVAGFSVGDVAWVVSCVRVVPSIPV